MKAVMAATVVLSFANCIPVQAENPPIPASSDPAEAWVQGQVDRQAWEAWFASLPEGQFKAGASWWASVRSTKQAAVGCVGPGYAGASDQKEWATGCLSAKAKLASTDYRRLANASYRGGWNSVNVAQSAPRPAPQADVEPSDRGRGGNRLDPTPPPPATEGAPNPPNSGGIATAQTSTSAAFPDEPGPTRRCREGDTNFAYSWSEPCAKVDTVLGKKESVKNENRTEIPLVEMNGIYKVPVLINGVLPLQFVLDTGAADVAIPGDVFSVLERTGTITPDDYIGTGRYRLADGSVVQSDRFYIRELKVGAHLLKHVSASIGDKAGSLLLGQSFLKRFESVQVDNTGHVLLLGSEASASAALSPPPAGFTPNQPPQFDPTKPYTVVPSSPSSGGTTAASPAPIDLRKIKLSEITRPYSFSLPETVQFIISNASDQRVSEITIGNVQGLAGCSRDLSDYQSFKKFFVNLSSGDSIQVTGPFSSGNNFCVINAK